MDSTTMLPYTATAVLFTNNLGQVIFVDHVFLNLMKYPEAGTVTGEPLHKALRLDQDTGKLLLDDLRQKGSLRDRLVEVHDATNGTLRLYVNGFATYDPNGNFLGADIMLRQSVEENEAPEEMLEHLNEDVTIPSRDMLSETTFGEYGQFLELYFTTHIKAHYVLFQRLIGLMARGNLDKLINQTAKKNGWTIEIKNGLFLRPLTGTTPEVYQALLREVLNYGVNMVGLRIVSRSVDKVDQDLHEGLIGLAQQHGLFQLYKNL
jgi:hypothetical protein